MTQRGHRRQTVFFQDDDRLRRVRMVPATRADSRGRLLSSATITMLDDRLAQLVGSRLRALRQTKRLRLMHLVDILCIEILA